MTPHTDIDQFLAVDIYDIDDPVLGGDAGESNDPIKTLADRTRYLFNRLGRYLGLRNISASGSITVSDKFKLLKAISAANITLTIETVANFKPGDILTVKASTTANGKAVKLVPAGAETIMDGIVNMATAGLFLHDGDTVVLMAGDANDDNTADFWEVIDLKGNYDRIGKDDFVRVQPRNTIIANGCNPESGGALYLRADYPRVWAAVESGAISDGTWLSDSVRFRSFFSTGNGSTTFRAPDMRSMSMKGLDLGRGLSLSRMDNQPGGIELDAIKAHTHDISQLKKQDTQGGDQQNTPYNGPDHGATTFPTLIKTDSTGGTENLIKNSGFIPVIYY